VRLALKLFCSIAFLYVALRQVELGQVARLLANSRAASGGALLSPLSLWTLLAVGVSLSASLVNSTKWWLLLRGAGLDVAWRRAAYHYLVGYFLNNIITGLGEVKRVVDVGRETGAVSAVASTVFVERWTGVTGHLFVSLIAVSVAASRYESLRPVWVFNACACVGLLLVFVVLAGASARGGDGLDSGSVSQEERPLVALWRSALDAFARMRGARGVMGAACGLSLVVPLMNVVIHGCLGAAIGAGWGFVWVVPIAGVFGQLPVSFNGVGVQEVAYVSLFACTGVGGAQAVAISVLAHGVKVAVGAVGWVLSLFGRASSPDLEPVQGDGEPAPDEPRQEGVSLRS